MKYQDIKSKQVVGSIINPLYPYRVLSKNNGWVRIKVIVPRGEYGDTYNVRAKILAPREAA